MSTQASTSNSERDIFCRLTRNRYVGQRALFAAFEPAESIRRGDAIGSRWLQSQQHTHYVVASCVDSNIHYPTDSSLLADGIRVLSRGLARIARECKSGAVKVVNHARAVKYRLLEISRAAKSLTPVNQRRMKQSYEQLVALARQVVRQTGKVRKCWHEGKLPVVGSLSSVTTQMARLQHFLPLVGKVIQQTQQRCSYDLTSGVDRQSTAASAW